MPFVADTDDLDRLAELPGEVAERLGPVDILVTNTGGPPAGGALAHGIDEWQAAYRSLVLAPKVLVDAVLPGMREREVGPHRERRVPDHARAEPRLNLSNAHRMATVGYFKTLAGEVAADGVTVNTIATGRIATRPARRALRALARGDRGARAGGDPRRQARPPRGIRGPRGLRRVGPGRLPDRDPDPARRRPPALRLRRLAGQRQRLCRLHLAKPGSGLAGIRGNARRGDGCEETYDDRDHGVRHGVSGRGRGRARARAARPPGLPAAAAGSAALLDLQLRRRPTRSGSWSTTIPTGNPHTDLDFFTQGGDTFASVGTLGIGPNGGGQTIVRLTQGGAVDPEFVAGHPSASCLSSPADATGLQHDVEATPKGDALLNTDNPLRRPLRHAAARSTPPTPPAAATTRAISGSPASPQGGLEIVDVTDPAAPKEIGLISHIGESHTVNVDPKRPHIAYSVTSDSVSVNEDGTRAERVGHAAWTSTGSRSSTSPRA